MSKVGVLFVNVGSPSRPEEKEVASYLKKFLMDKNIIDIPFVLRWILVHLLIVPKRAALSAANYRKIWMKSENKSPLIYNSEQFVKTISEYLRDEFELQLGMCCSDPNVAAGLDLLSNKNCEKIIVIPLFPQFAQATTGSVVDLVNQWKIKNKSIQNNIHILPAFYDKEFFYKRQAQLSLQELADKKDHFILFSFHGLPERQVLKNNFCKLSSHCCEEPQNIKRNCYRAQCLQTAQKLALEMGLKKENWQVSFQSRLGRAKWIGPSTHDVLLSLAQSGKKRIAVLCPSFVADCLETLEEIGLEERNHFISNGGTDFTLLSCLNSDSIWAQGFAGFIKEVKATL